MYPNVAKPRGHQAISELIERRVRTEPARLAEALEDRVQARILIEASTESAWVLTTVPSVQLRLGRRQPADDDHPAGIVKRGARRRGWAITRRREIAERLMSSIRRLSLIVLIATALAGCAGVGLREPLRVSLAGLEPLAGAGMEARFLAKIRVQNPNDAPIAYDGLTVEVDLNGRSFASGVGDAKGEFPRFGESLVELPITVPASSIVRQVLGFVTGDRTKATYRARGFFNTGTFGRVPFDSTGEIDLPKMPAGG